MWNKVEIRKANWLEFKGGRYITASGTDVTPFLWSRDKRLWLWLLTLHDDLLKELMPSCLGSTTYQGFKKGIVETNMYRARMIHKLTKYAKKGKSKEFNTLMKVLTRKSKSFRAWIMDSTTDFKAKDLNFKDLRKAHITFQWMVNGQMRDFKFRRVWIDKPDGTKRPLSVPTIEERWLAKMMLIWTEIWMNGMKVVPSENQYGSIARRSTTMAWNRVFKVLLPKRHIWEFDVQKCYDTISWNAVARLCLRCRMPFGIHNYIINTMVTAPNNLNDPLIDDETYRKLRYEAVNIGILEEMKGTGKWMSWAKGVVRQESHSSEIEQMIEWRKKATKGMKMPDPETMPMEIRHRIAIQDVRGLYDESYEPPVTIFDSSKKRLEIWDCGLGIPQGWALSPLITNIIIKIVMRQTGEKAEWLTYLDDGIIAADEMEDFSFTELMESFNHNGLCIKASKTKFVKKDGKWIHDLKFLGALLTTTGEFFGATRKGSQVRLKVPPIGISTLEENDPNEWKDRVIEFAERHGLSEGQMGWIYNKGGFHDGKRFVPISLEDMTEKALTSKWVSEWFQDDSIEKRGIIKWVKRVNMERRIREAKKAHRKYQYQNRLLRQRWENVRIRSFEGIVQKQNRPGRV